MAKHLGNMVARFAEYTDLDGNTLSDWRDEYLGLSGMLSIYESENKAPSKKFIYFYPNEPAADVQRYFHTSVGEVTESESTVIVETHGRYVFEIGDFLSEEDKELLWLNVFMM